MTQGSCWHSVSHTVSAYHITMITIVIIITIITSASQVKALSLSP